MSGRTKIAVYRTLDWLLWIGAIVGCVLMFLLMPEEIGAGEWVAGVFLILCVALRIPVTVHEAGHAAVGALAGFGVKSFTLSLFRLSGEGVKFSGYAEEFAGMTELVPHNGRGLRAKLILVSLAGAMFDLVLGLPILLLCTLLPYHAIGLFGGMLSLFLICNGIRALCPVELPEGQTDGSNALSMAKRTSEAQVELAVWTAQGILYKGTFGEIPRELLFETPVVREDLPAFRELLRLRVLYALCEGDGAQAATCMERLQTLSDYFTPAERSFSERYLPCIKGEALVYEDEEEELYGIAELNGKLKKRGDEKQ